MEQPLEKPQLIPPVGEHDRVRGSGNAPVTVVEYGDYDCPYTVRAYAIVRGLRKRMGDRMRFVFRSFPLTEIHAQAAAEAAETATAQGRFWEMHDKLFEARRQLEYEDLVRYAEEVDLDLDRFEEEMAQHAHVGGLRKSLESGLASGVQGTPTFFINGVRYDGSYHLDALLAALENELGKIPEFDSG